MKPPKFPQHVFVTHESEDNINEAWRIREDAEGFIEKGSQKKHVARYVLEAVLTVESKITVVSGAH